MSRDKTEHELKTWPEFFEGILNETKGFEVRLNDRDFQIGDILVLQEYLPKQHIYTGRSIKLQIKSIWHNLPGLPDNVCVMDIGDLPGLSRRMCIIYNSENEE